jgi:hypothetical protein
MRRDFKLPADDEVFLDSREADWEAIRDNGTQWLVIENYDLPSGYNVSQSSLALRIQDMYPDVQIDMAYFAPALARTDGKQMNALSLTTMLGKQWQQWSRHRVGEDAWQIGVDNVQRHLDYVRAFLEGELRKP